MSNQEHPKLLIVDDDVSFVRSAAELGRLEGFEITVAADLRQARSRMREATFDLAVIDLSLPDGSGLDLLQDYDALLTTCVLVTGNPTIESAMRAVKGPVFDYIVKPLDPDVYRDLLRSVASTRTLRAPSASPNWHGLVGTSAALQGVIQQIGRVASSDSSVLIYGESGVGKELVARAIHAVSGREGALVSINCGAVPPDLLASQLFGHERGSFTGATGRHVGYFEQAQGGTLFLDEVIEMPVHLQVHLLRALETGMVRRVGDTRDIPVDARIVAASNRAPARAMQEGRLREDLYYRLAEFLIDVPPLRERPSDIEALAQLFLGSLNARRGTTKGFTPKALEKLRDYPWPGNVRELRNVVGRAYLMEPQGTIGALALELAGERPVEETETTITIPIGMKFEEVERRLLLKTLNYCGNNKTRAARALGISVRTLYSRLEKYSEDSALVGERGARQH